MVPQSPLDVALYALGGPWGKAAKTGALAAGGLLSMSDEAQAGPTGLLEKAGKAAADAAPEAIKRSDAPLFDYSRMADVPNVPQTPLERYVPPRGYLSAPRI